MDAIFFGGPYDGLSLNHEQIRKCAQIVAVLEKNRQFLLMPPVREWEEVVAGLRPKDECSSFYVYKRHRVEDRVEYRDVTASGG
jgi:hypothetical protein